MLSLELRVPEGRLCSSGSDSARAAPRRHRRRGSTTDEPFYRDETAPLLIELLHQRAEKPWERRSAPWDEVFARASEGPREVNGGIGPWPGLA